ncbi:hypothetical protein MVLG_03333 [Microbotryum lychnidis-dioicae p1A1 Lamole]|uniref:Histone H1 n=1 Tax=Microbotryum lychnidis-dioicae (strain p1A1 Lamole / MvSl-1064) TaxID=683840 RepID=U5H7W3_USTV1|nr:hypothetical protein MVLG_03333 [Microbotryum lychnidis-dioicae p1A1 Lamole]|eukprot:KDE06293.1 hypothetical protein MVLG_03333 [Microbotryum lychnidis-dioicae p1A1 Lamole]
MVKNHPTYADMVYEAFVNVDRHTKLAHVKIKKYLQEVYEIDLNKTSSKLALKRALEHAVDEGLLQLIGASYKMTATGLHHLQGARFSSEPDPKKPKKEIVKKPAVKKSTTRIKTVMKARVKAGTLAASKKKTNAGKTKKTNGLVMNKVKTRVKTSADAKNKDKLATTSNKIVVVPIKGDAETLAEPTLLDERPPAEGEEPQTETEREEDEDGELPAPQVGGLEARVAVGGKDEEQVTPEKNKIHGRGSGGLDVGQGPGAPRKKSAHGGE